MSILKMKDLHYSVPADDENLVILDRCELTIETNESIAIIGRSGSGKSTLLSIMAGLQLPTQGEIALFNHSLIGLNEDERAKIRAEKVGFVFQNFQLMPTMTALENVLMPLELFDQKNAFEKAKSALEQVGLSHRLDHRPAELSGGEQQRVAIARAFVTQPKVLFADEPTGNLDETTADSIQSLLFQLQQTFGTTLVIVTHDLDYAHKCDRQVLLQHGCLQETTAARGAS